MLSSFSEIKAYLTSFPLSADKYNSSDVSAAGWVLCRSTPPRPRGPGDTTYRCQTPEDLRTLRREPREHRGQLTRFLI